jgi:hypothetical protein
VTKPNLERYFAQVLRFIDDRRAASSKEIGVHLSASHGFGTKVANQMVKAGLLKWLPDAEAYSVSDAGRDILGS